jgi:hypothetical protein
VHAARRFEGFRIVLFAILAAVGYGILHDQVTAHLCVEYFTVAHPPVFPTESPFLLALGWGVIATWWVGLALGTGLAATARIGSLPKLGLAELRRPIFLLMLFSAIAALAAGLLGALLFATGIVPLSAEWASVIPPGKHAAFAAAAWAHGASYAAGGLGGLLLMGLAVRRRVRLARCAMDRPGERPAASPHGAAAPAGDPHADLV